MSLVLALESRSKGSNTCSIRNIVVDDERMRSGHWFGFMLHVPLPLISKGYLLEQMEEENLRKTGWKMIKREVSRFVVIMT